MTLKHSRRTCLVLLILFHFTGNSALASDVNIDDRNPSTEIPTFNKKAPTPELESSLGVESVDQSEITSGQEDSKDTQEEDKLKKAAETEISVTKAAETKPFEVSPADSSLSKTDSSLVSASKTSPSKNQTLEDSKVAAEAIEGANDTINIDTKNVTDVTVIDIDTTDIDAADVKKELSLLGNSVEPGEAALLKWVFADTFAGNSASVPVLVVNGQEPGPTLCLTAAVHGDELNGIEIVRRTVHEINAQELSGAVIGVPIVNFQGFRRASRYLPDRRDLNRYFPGSPHGSYASRIAHSFFDNVIRHCDFLIDLHTGSLSRTNLPQIRADLLDPEIASLAEKMGPIVVLQSKAASGTLRRAASEAGIPTVTLEAGAPNNLQKDAVEIGVKSVLSALSSLGLSPAAKPFWKRNAEPVFYKSTWIRTKVGGILFSKIELGDTVKKDTVLGLISDPISNRTNEIVAPFEGRVIGMALNQVMHPGYAAYHIGLKSSIKEAAQPNEIDPDTGDVDLAATSPESNSQSDAQSTAQDDTQEVIEETAKADTSELAEPAEPEKEPIEEMELPTIDK